MFIYEKGGKLNINVASNMSSDTPDIVIEPVAGTPVTAKVTINSENVAVGGSFTQIPADTDVSDLAKLVTALTTAGIIAAS
ncbi:MAG: hypothetical protein J6S67_19910 [Methanobrevibacter sp.]|nr:hypothetical protein [Methanobrevibacter sp.]